MKHSENHNLLIKSKRSSKRNNIIYAVLIVLLITVFNLLSTLVFVRCDLTGEKRFSITPTTQNILDSLDDDVFIEVFLEGKDLPVELVRYKKVVDEFLANLSACSKRVDVVFTDPFADATGDDIPRIHRDLYSRGLNPTLINQNSEGQVSEKMLFAGALVRYKGKEYPVNLLNSNYLAGDEAFAGLSETELERDFSHAIWKLSRNKIQKIAFLDGNKELDTLQTMDIMSTLSKYYAVDRVKMNGVLHALDDYDVVIVARPQRYFNERDKFIIDQYIMNGGKMIWLIEWMEMSLDSLQDKPSAMAMLRDINLSDQLFNYGVRINPDLIQDLRCLRIPVYVNTIDGKPQFEPRKWFYFPLIVPDTLLRHPLLQNLAPMRTTFVSSIDTVGQDPDVKKTILLRTSPQSKALVHPVEVDLGILNQPVEPQTFNKPNIPIAVLLEGRFKSNFINRMPDELYYSKDFPFVEKSKPTKMIVISDGNFIENYVVRHGNRYEFLPLGADKYYAEQQYTPGNSQFFVNCVNYLCADEGLISLRMREIKIRNMNPVTLADERPMWALVNTIVPILIVIVAGLCVIITRKCKYRRQKC